METSKPKPDLMAGATSSRRSTQDKRILAHLEHGAKAPARTVHAAGWTIDGWTIGLFVLLLLMCSMAWLMHDRTITADTFRQSYSSGATSRMASHAAAPAQHDAADAPQAAAIVNVETADATAVEAETPTAATVAIANAAHAARPTSAQAQPAHALAATPKATMRAPMATSPTTPATTDTDVTLLAALVAHAGTPAAVTPERSRDIVDRQDGDTTAQLLARCKQLGLIEGMLCRSRICSGRWESDAACRAPSH